MDDQQLQIAEKQLLNLELFEAEKIFVNCLSSDCLFQKIRSIIGAASVWFKYVEIHHHHHHPHHHHHHHYLQSSIIQILVNLIFAYHSAKTALVLLKEQKSTSNSASSEQKILEIENKATRLLNRIEISLSNEIEKILAGNSNSNFSFDVILTCVISLISKKKIYPVVSQHSIEQNSSKFSAVDISPNPLNQTIHHSDCSSPAIAAQPEISSTDLDKAEAKRTKPNFEEIQKTIQGIIGDISLDMKLQYDGLRTKLPRRLMENRLTSELILRLSQEDTTESKKLLKVIDPEAGKVEEDKFLLRIQKDLEKEKTPVRIDYKSESENETESDNFETLKLDLSQIFKQNKFKIKRNINRTSKVLASSNPHNQIVIHFSDSKPKQKLIEEQPHEYFRLNKIVRRYPLLVKLWRKGNEVSSTNTTDKNVKNEVGKKESHDVISNLNSSDIFTPDNLIATFLNYCYRQSAGKFSFNDAYLLSLVEACLYFADSHQFWKTNILDFCSLLQKSSTVFAANKRQSESNCYLLLAIRCLTCENGSGDALSSAFEQLGDLCLSSQLRKESLLLKLMQLMKLELGGEDKSKHQLLSERKIEKQSNFEDNKRIVRHRNCVSDTNLNVNSQISRTRLSDKHSYGNIDEINESLDDTKRGQNSLNLNSKNTASDSYISKGFRSFDCDKNRDSVGSSNGRRVNGPRDGNHSNHRLYDGENNSRLENMAILEEDGRSDCEDSSESSDEDSYLTCLQDAVTSYSNALKHLHQFPPKQTSSEGNLGNDDKANEAKRNAANVIANKYEKNISSSPGDLPTANVSTPGNLLQNNTVTLRGSSRTTNADFRNFNNKFSNQGDALKVKYEDKNTGECPRDDNEKERNESAVMEAKKKCVQHKLAECLLMKEEYRRAIVYYDEAISGGLDNSYTALKPAEYSQALLGLAVLCFKSGLAVRCRSLLETCCALQRRLLKESGLEGETMESVNVLAFLCLVEAELGRRPEKAAVIGLRAVRGYKQLFDGARLKNLDRMNRWFYVQVLISVSQIFINLGSSNKSAGYLHSAKSLCLATLKPDCLQMGLICKLEGDACIYKRDETTGVEAEDQTDHDNINCTDAVLQNRSNFRGYSSNDQRGVQRNTNIQIENNRTGGKIVNTDLEKFRQIKKDTNKSDDFKNSQNHNESDKTHLGQLDLKILRNNATCIVNSHVQKNRLQEIGSPQKFCIKTFAQKVDPHDSTKEVHNPVVYQTKDEVNGNQPNSSIDNTASKSLQNKDFNLCIVKKTRLMDTATIFNSAIKPNDASKPATLVDEGLGYKDKSIAVSSNLANGQNEYKTNDADFINHERQNKGDLLHKTDLELLGEDEKASYDEYETIFQSIISDGGHPKTIDEIMASADDFKEKCKLARPSYLEALEWLEKCDLKHGRLMAEEIKRWLNEIMDPRTRLIS